MVPGRLSGALYGCFLIGARKWLQEASLGLSEAIFLPGFENASRTPLWLSGDVFYSRQWLARASFAHRSLRVSVIFDMPEPSASLCPGQENPGQENPGQENPGPGQENPGQENPGQENP
eukprot:10401923-Karenia_brevis.AAC.1